MVSAPLFGRGLGGRLDPSQDLLEAAPRGGLGLEFAEELAIGGDQGTGAADHEGDLIVAITLGHEERNTCECGDIVLNGTEGMIQPTSDLVGLESLEIETHGLDAVGLARADVLLLTAGGDFETRGGGGPGHRARWCGPRS